MTNQMATIVNADIVSMKIRSRRKEKNLTLEQLAEKAGLGGKAVLSKYENGRIPPVELLVSIADALECDPDYLIGRQDLPDRVSSDIYEELPLSKEAIEKLMMLKKALKTDDPALLGACMIAGIIDVLIIDLITKCLREA